VQGSSKPSLKGKENAVPKGASFVKSEKGSKVVNDSTASSSLPVKSEAEDQKVSSKAVVPKKSGLLDWSKAKTKETPKPVPVKTEPKELAKPKRSETLDESKLNKPIPKVCLPMTYVLDVSTE
jgi:hypothetical protein